MNPKIKNIIIFAVVAVALILVYVLFLKPAPQEANLTTSSGASVIPNTNTSDQNNTIGANFLATLLSVKNITLDDSIFNDPTFATLRDTSIVLVPDQTQGRPNPFAPIGTDVLPTSSTQTGTLTPTTGSSESVPSGTVGAPSGTSSTGSSSSSSSDNSSGTSPSESGATAPTSAATPSATSNSTSGTSDNTTSGSTGSSTQ
jgi:hypothetical protein